jgi:hypothetical protein
LRSRKGEQAERARRIDLDQEIDIALWAEIAAGYGTEQGEARQAPRPQLVLALPQHPQDAIALLRRGGRNRFDLCGHGDVMVPRQPCARRVAHRANDFDHAKVKAGIDGCEPPEAFQAIDVEAFRARPVTMTSPRCGGLCINTTWFP